MGDDQHRCTTAGGIPQQCAHLLHVETVEPAGRLVQYDEPLAAHERRAYRHTLFLAAGQAQRMPVSERGEVEVGEQSVPTSRELRIGLIHAESQLVAHAVGEQPVVDRNPARMRS